MILIISTILVIVLPAILYYYQFTKPYSYFRKRGIAGPKPKIIFGNLLDYQNQFELRHESLSLNAQKYGKIYGYYYGKYPVLHISDVDMAKEVLLKQSKNFINRFSFTAASRKSVGLLQARDETWKNARESLSPLFSPANLKEMAAFTLKASQTLLQKMLEASSQSPNNSIDVRRLFYNATMEASMASLFGIELDVQNHESQLQKELSTFIKSSADYSVAVSISLPAIMKYVGFLFNHRRLLALIKAVGILKQIVEERRQEILQTAGKNNRKDMLTLILKAEDNKKISTNDAVQHCLTFLVGGYDTTASTLCFVAHLLATHPRVQSRVLAEIDEKCPHENSLTYQNISKLTYMDMVINESIRIFSPGYINLREAKQDCWINGIEIAKGTGVAIAVKAIHEDPTLWPEPQKFIPERFSPDKITNHHCCSFLPFSEGPRGCIGRKLGLINLKLTLARLLQKLQFKISDKTEVPMPTITQFTLVPKNPVYLRIVPRKEIH